MGAARRRVVVVGGGILGCAAAFELARAGHDVVLVERDGIAAHASRHNAGKLNPLFGTPLQLIPFALESFRVHEEVSRELSTLGCLKSASHPVDRIHLCRDEKERRELEAVAVLYNAVEGFSAGWLDAIDLYRTEQRLSRGFLCALKTTGAKSVNSSDLAHSMVAGARKLGAIIREGTVDGVDASGGSILAVRLGSERLPCDDCVFATGPWTTETESWLGTTIPIKPVKGQMIRVEIERPLQSDFTWNEHCLYHRAGNEVWIGGTMEDAGPSSDPTAEAAGLLMAGAMAIMPGLGEAKRIEQIAAVRPMPESKMPIAARADGWQNVYIANGGGSKGVLLSVGIARRIRDLIAEG